MSFSSLAFRGLLLGGALSALMACGPEYDRTEITGATHSPLGGDVSAQRIEVPQGLIVTARIVAWNDDKDPLQLTVRSKDTGRLVVTPTVNDRVYAFSGKDVGLTEVEFLADGNVVMTVQANVTAQPTTP